MTDYRHTWSSFVSVLLLLSTGCEEGGFTPSTGTDGGVRPPPVHTDGGIPDSGMGAEPPDPLEATLNQLGVDTSDSPRLDDNSEPLPDSYLPLGGSFPLNRTTELFLAGVSLGDPTMPGTFDGLDSEVAFIRTEEETGVLHEEDSPEPSWAVHQTRDRDFSRTTRAAALADIDGDGREETVVAYSTESADRELRLTIFEDAEHTPPFDTTEALVQVNTAVIREVAVVGSDVDGDGFHEVVVGVTSDEGAKLLFITDLTGTPTVRQTQQLEVQTSDDDWEWGLQLASGQFDYDPGTELAVVLNESATDFFGAITSFSGHLIFDDASGNFTELSSGTIESKAGGRTTALVADVDTGDIDGDGLDEVVFGGLDAFKTSHNEPAKLVGMALDDAVRNFATVGDVTKTLYSDGNKASPYWRFIHVTALDVDDNGADEIAFGNIVYDNFRDNAPWVERFEAPQELMFREGEFVGRSTTHSAAGDTNGDGREDLLLFNQGNSYISIWGIHGLDPTWGEIKRIETEFHNSQTPRNAIVLPINVNSDSPVLRYAGREHQLVFSEPVVIAALAAPPCQEGIEQNLDDCVTAFGTATTSTVTTEQVLSVGASVSVGLNIDGGFFTQSELELRATVTSEASSIQSDAYTLEKSIVFTTGPNQDSVVFTTIPYDRYVYTVASHPDPELVGDEIVVYLPREPVTLLTERAFYNERVEEGELQIDNRVFTHRPGDLSSYPNPGAKNAALLNGGLEIGPQSVGQGDGSVKLGLAVGEEYSSGRALELGFEFSMDVTGGGVLAGTTVGASRQDTITITSGSETSYTGSIGGIDAANFSDNQYSFGLFTYVQRDRATGQEFEVINYWVE